MSDNRCNPTVVALGYFDSVHLGHRRVIESAKKLAEELNASLTVFTFGGNLRATISRKDEKFVYSAEERKAIFEELGVQNIFVQRADFDFLSMGKLAYLNWINKKFDIKGYVCGADFKFGKFAKGTVEDLERYAKTHSQALKIVDTVDDFGKRISTSRIKALLSAGDIAGANALLVRHFSVTGEVVRGKGVGVTMGFPTANIKLDNDKQPLREGVYGGHIFIDGKRYDTVINFGPRPTFGGTETVVEAYILDYDGDLYGKTVTLFFDTFIREIRKFFSAEELIKQIRSDAESLKNAAGKGENK